MSVIIRIWTGIAQMECNLIEIYKTYLYQ